MMQIMENDLISREALKKAVRESYHNNPHPLSRDQHMHRHEHNHMIELIEAAPAVDAVEVVRCKDCKWFKKGQPFRHECKKVGHGMNYIEPDDFCSYGERRTHNG